MADKSEADQDYEHVVTLADRLGLKGRDREDYIHKHMTGFGYKAKRTYHKPEDDDKRSGGFFGRSRDDDDDDDF